MAPSLDLERIRLASAKHPCPPHYQPTYGTAGFRAEASLLDSTIFRCGLLTAARAMVTGAHCGLMITASHNPVADNGVKIVEPAGEMLVQSWEPLATELAQCRDDEEVAKILQRAVQQGNEGNGHSNGSAAKLSVVIGYDTRPSAPKLVAAAEAGVAAMGLAVANCGPVTTPQLHFYTWARNFHPSHPEPPATDLYFDTLIGAFEQLVAKGPGKAVSLVVDCANGVGAQHIQAALPRLAAAGLSMRLANTGDGELNHLSGADYVQKDKVLPAGMADVTTEDRCCSVDGDADRLVYFIKEEGNKVLLIDGDKIATLVAAYVADLVKGLPDGIRAGAKVGVVQTAYANGASTAYITGKLGLSVTCTPTGVKHLHVAAHEHYDVGAYFEANGHGTVLFSHRLLEQLKKAADSSSGAKEMLLLSEVINQTVGDALSGILMVEAILRRKNWSLQDWAGLYTDLPSRMTKLTVGDRNVITTADAERKCVTPKGLQEAIDAVVAKFGSSARSFVRPSGTEDAVRVYAEATTQEQADELAAEVGRVVFDMAGGVGKRP